MSAIDTSGVSLLKDLRLSLEKKNVEARENSFQTVHRSLLCCSIFPRMMSMTVCFHFTQLVLVNPVGEVMEKLQKADEGHDLLGQDRLYLSVGEAVTSLSSFMKPQCPAAHV